MCSHPLCRLPACLRGACLPEPCLPACLQIPWGNHSAQVRWLRKDLAKGEHPWGRRCCCRLACLAAPAGCRVPVPAHLPACLVKPLRLPVCTTQLTAAVRPG